MAIILTAHPSSLELTQGEHVLAGGIRTYDVEFRFPEGDTTWDGMALVAVFESILGKWSSFVDVTTYSCKIPWEVLDEGSEGSHLTIGLYGVKEDDTNIIVRSTVWVDMPFRILPGPNAVPTQEPSPSVYQQILASNATVVQMSAGLKETEEALFTIANQVTELCAEAEKQAAAAAKSAELAYKSGVTFETDETLILENAVLRVNLVKELEDKDLPISAAAVKATVGDIETLLATV